MSCVSLKYYIVIVLTIFVTCLLTEIECCSMSTDDIITLMTHNANFQSDPCFKEWKDAQDAKLLGILSHQDDEIQKQVREYNEATKKNSTHSERKLSILGPLAFISFIIALIAFCCYLFCLLSCAYGNGDLTSTAVTNVPQSVSSRVQTTPFVSSYPLGHQPTSDNNGNENVGNLIASAPLPSLPLVNRQTSLPTYEDAVKMAPTMMVE